MRSFFVFLPEEEPPVVLRLVVFLFVAMVLTSKKARITKIILAFFPYGGATIYCPSK
jgi:hypothetical protein